MFKRNYDGGYRILQWQDLNDFKYYILDELDRVAERKNYENLKITIEEI
jgi:hypothetical protein